MNNHYQNKQFSRVTKQTLISQNDIVSRRNSISHKSKSKDNFYSISFQNHQNQIKRFYTAQNALIQQNQQKNKNISQKFIKATSSIESKVKKIKQPNSLHKNHIYFPKQNYILGKIKSKEKMKQQPIKSQLETQKIKMKNYENRIKTSNQNNQTQPQSSFLKKLNQEKKLKIMQIYRPKVSKNKHIIKNNTEKESFVEKKFQSYQNKKQKQIQLKTNLFQKNNESQQKNRKVNRNSQINYRYQILEQSSQKRNYRINSSDNKLKQNKKIVPKSLIQMNFKDRKSFNNSTIEDVQKPVVFQNKNQKLQKKENLKDKFISQKNKQNPSSSFLLPKYTDFYDSFINDGYKLNYQQKQYKKINYPLTEQTNKLIDNRYSPSISKVRKNNFTPSILDFQQQSKAKIKDTQNQFQKSFINQMDIKERILNKNYTPKLKIITNQNNFENFKFLKMQNCTYFGQLSIQNIPHGIGMVFYKNGKLYQGQFQNGIKKGQGYELYSDSSFYLGSFAQNKKNGKGRFQWHNGQIYDGQWLNNQRHGSGQWIASNISYVGQWKNNIIQGFGILIEGKQRYEGSFINFKKQGHGTYRYQNGEVYIGDFKNNCLNGQGQYYWPNGDYFKGQFSNNKRHGTGFLALVNSGINFKGQFRNDKKCGLGVQFYNQELVYIGNFQNDLKHGWGCLKRNQQIIYQGYWINNRIIEVSQTPSIDLIIEQENEQNLKNQISQENLNKYVKNDKEKQIVAAYSQKFFINYEARPKPKDPQLIKGRSRYMRINNTYIKKSLQNSNDKNISRSRSPMIKKQRQKQSINQQTVNKI